jgi:hypothetical protein
VPFCYVGIDDVCGVEKCETFVLEEFRVGLLVQISTSALFIRVGRCLNSYRLDYGAVLG